MEARKPGYYWVELNGILRIARTIGDPGPEFWALTFNPQYDKNRLYTDEDFEWIASDPIKEPERMS